MTLLPRLPQQLLSDDPEPAAKLVARYFDTTGSRPPYSGAFFERLDGGGDRPDVRNRITGADIVAVSMLSVDIPAGTILEMHEHAAQITGLLESIPTDLDLVDATAMELAVGGPAWQLWELLDSIKGIKWVTANKILARKRPQLLPVYDNVVRELLREPENFWESLRVALQADGGALHQRLLAIRDSAAVGSDISPLRVFDVTCWMIGTATG